ncbi:hypothetical protein ILUMI_01140 [Ignelater luminosus]|uniref:sulfite oxidase n=1 Tax=Ignelater luminosus TaxID=2038154 RepID=A0A8K0GLZ9_IGNLU|nr:hypothetical protein ILUMI_01140 [Ignelater luminosus]
MREELRANTNNGSGANFIFRLAKGLSVFNNSQLRNIIIRCSSQSFNNSYTNQDYDDKYYKRAGNAIIGTALVSWIAYKLYENKGHVQVKAATPTATTTTTVTNIGVYNPNLPNYTLEQVSQHASSDKVWVTFKQGVYDITKFVSEHPGGDQIMLAAGSSVEPFWLLYAVHNNPQVLNMLESMRIGNLSAEEAKQATSNMSDPYCNDPRRHAALKPASVKPFNAELPPSLLVESFLTPNELFYVRNHLPVPEVDVSAYELEIEAEGTKKTVILTYEELKKFPKHTVTATIMCAGNRRSEMTKVKTVKGLDWGAAAIGNATWSGARLRDVLRLAGIDEDSKEFNHVQFEGLDMDPTGKPYGASIPFWKAVDKRGDVILAYEMNGQPIPRDHGYPIRAIVPGIVGARNVKWLGKIVVSKEESDSHWQQNDYKGFSPSTDWDTVDFTKSPAIQELPVISAICKPSPGQTVTVVDNHILVQGYAWSGGGQKIVRVDVTIDGGNSWHVATFDHQDETPSPQHWAWTLWSARIPIPKGSKNIEIWAKAVDSSYNTQPESFKNIWNLRGVLSNAYHRVPAELKWKR